MDPATIHKNLQAAFKSVSGLHEKWNNVDSKIRGTLQPLVYAADQLQGVQKADLTKSEIAKRFPDACDLLVYDLDGELENGLMAISEALEEQEGIVCELLSIHQAEMDRSNAADDLCYGDCGEWPPVPTMLQALGKVHTLCYTIYQQRKFHVENLDWRDESKVNRMVQSWGKQKQLADTVEDILARLEEHQKETF